MTAELNTVCSVSDNAISLQCVPSEGAQVDGPLLRLDLANLEGNAAARDFFRDSSSYKIVIERG